MVGRVPPLSSPPVVPFRSFLPTNLLRACPSGRRASVPSFPQRPIVVRPSERLNSRRLILLQTLCRRQKGQVLCNQANPNSFAKTPAWGYHRAFEPSLPYTGHMRHVTPISPVSSVDCAYFPSPRGCTQAILPALGASVSLRQTHPFQAFAASLPSFSTTRPLFSIACSLFSKNTRVGGGPRLHRSPLHRRLTRP